MDTVELAYKILYNLEHNERPEYMGQIISPEKLGATSTEWLGMLQELNENEYITGVSIRENILGEFDVDFARVRITIKGAEFLRENSAFARFRNIATNVIRVTADVAKIIKP